MTSRAQTEDFIAAINSHPRGRGLKPAFEALWHLEELKVVENLKSYSSDAWDIAESHTPPVVVVMDTPMDIDHPNLEVSIDRARMRDFSVYSDGAFPIDFNTLNQAEKSDRQVIATTLQSALESHQASRNQESELNHPLARLTTAVKTELLAGELEDSHTMNPRPRHTLVTQLPGAHGTAVAGLIAGRPAVRPLQTAAYLGATNEPSVTIPASLPYAGINPYARVVPISLTAAPYPDMVLGALTYIEAIKPDVIVIAAAWADPIDLNGALSEDSSWPIELHEEGYGWSNHADDSQENPQQRDMDLWAAVTNKIKSLSRNSIVLCAAGNVDSDQLVYPASLCSENDNDIWGVTACDTQGEKLSYAPKLRSDIRMIKTLSTQLPRADKGETVVDPYEIKLPELRVKHVAPTDITARDIITLDPTGRQGYNPTDYPVSSESLEEPLLEIGSLYTRFSGTSAATAIAGGLASLALSMSDEEPVGITPDRGMLFDLDQARALFRGRITHKSPT